MKENRTQRPGRVHNLIAGGLIIFAAASFLGAIREQPQGRRVQKEYESLAQMAGNENVPGDTVSGDMGQWPEKDQSEAADPEKRKRQKTTYESPVNFEKLSAINPDIAGWIRIPDTEIDYPIVQGSDNNMYLHKSFSGDTADAGCIFLDFESRRNLRGYNNILYGHNMKNGTMFRDVVRYKDEEYFKEHQYFEIYTPEETIHLKAVSCYYIGNDSQVRRTEFRDEKAFQTFVQGMLEPCRFAELPKEPVKNLYTLVTCSYETEDGRTVLFAVETDGEEAERAGRQGESAEV